MDTEILDRAALLLRFAPDRTLTLARLHAILAAHHSADRLAALLAADRRFLLVRGPDPLAVVSLACDAPTRDRYVFALREATGDGLRVSLADATPEEEDLGPIALIERSLLQLRTTRDAPGMACRIAEAQAEYGALVRSLPAQIVR